jgi:hypothetical protein
MQITVIIPSRGRVRGLNTLLDSLMAMESGKHHITYGVCCDDDDVATGIFCQSTQQEFPHKFAYNIGERPASLGGIINKMASYIPGDVYVALTDHCICLTPDWDDEIAKAVEETPYGIFFWTLARKLDGHLCIVTEKWRAAAGQVMSEDYPFWFDDLALLELYPMVTGTGAKHLPITLYFKGQKTHRLRDLKFWNDFFIFNRKIRVERAKEIAANLGLPVPEFAGDFAEALSKMFQPVSEERFNEITELQGDKSPPDASYIAAKERAKKIMGIE